jgi:hypothetical protein
VTLPRETRDRRRTALPREAYERILTCTSCGDQVAVFEAQTGAHTHHDHRFLNPDTYTCAQCDTETR